MTLSIELSKKIKSHVEANRKLPSTIKEGVITYTYAVALYIILQYLLNPKANIKSMTVGKPPAPTGDIVEVTITKKEYLGLAKTLVEFIKHNKRLPNYLQHKNKKLSPRVFTYAFAKILVFYHENKRLPETCLFTSKVFGSNNSKNTKMTKGGTVCKALANASNVTITDYNSLYKAFLFAVYKYYKNDCYKQSEALKRFSQKLGMNCADLGQLAYAALKELGYNVKIVRGEIKCTTGTFGHIWCILNTNGKMITFDASAAAKGKPLGTYICGSLKSITNYNPAWAVNDDGVT